MTRYTLEEAKYILGILAGRETGFTTATQSRDAIRTVLDHLAEGPEWEWTGEDEIHRRFTDKPEVVREWLKRGFSVRKRTKQVPAGPWVLVEN